MTTENRNPDARKAKRLLKAGIDPFTLTPAPASLPKAEGNDRYLVLDFERVYSEPGQPDSKYRYRVYLLPAHAHFAGFGGSSGGLVTGKTPSLIINTVGQGVSRDVEYNLADKGIWQYIIAEGLTNFSTLHGNGAPPAAECGFHR